MKQYLDLLKEIKQKGTKKPPARAGMPASTSLFGAQFRHNLQEGFPLLTTKKMFWKGVVVELLWFLKGDTNIKYLVDNGVNIWNEDAYSYYKKVYKNRSMILELEDFIAAIKGDWAQTDIRRHYKLGDCGYQYGKTWREWGDDYSVNEGCTGYVDQIKSLIERLKKNPESRRHIVTSIDPAHDEDLALYWCHAMFQMNCRPIYNQGEDYYAHTAPWIWGKNGEWTNNLNNTNYERIVPFKDKHPELFSRIAAQSGVTPLEICQADRKEMDEKGLPLYYLDCHMYQRSADAFLGVPFNIASYALLTHILAKICNMIPGDLITSYGDLHIYDNHMEAVNEQLSRNPEQLPTLKIIESAITGVDLDYLSIGQFEIVDYKYHPSIKGELSTGLK